MKCLFTLILAAFITMADAAERVNMTCKFDAAVTGYADKEYSVNLILKEGDLYNADGGSGYNHDMIYAGGASDDYTSFSIYDGSEYYKLDATGKFKRGPPPEWTIKTGKITCAVRRGWFDSYYRVHTDTPHVRDSTAEDKHAYSGKKAFIAVLPLSALGVSGPDADLITETLTSQLQNTQKFRIMERGQISSVLKEQDFQGSGACDNSGCAVEIGKLISVEQVVVGSFGKLGNSWVINVRMVDVRTGEITVNFSKQFSGEIDQVGSVTSGIATKMAQSIK